METDAKKLLKKHHNLIQSDMQKVSSHVQRESGEWVLHTLMIEGHDVPFRFKRKEKYKSLKGQRVNLTYYPEKENIAGMEMEMMKVVRVKRA